MKFKYSKFQGFDVSSINLGELMDSMSDALLDSGYDDDYYWTRQRKETDNSLDALRRALLQALMDQGLVDEQQIREMLAENEGKFQGSLLEELLNQLIERLVEEGYLSLREASNHNAPSVNKATRGPGEVSDPLPRDVRFEVTEKGLDFLGYKTLRNLLGSFGKSAAGRHDTVYLSTGVEAAAASKRYEFGDTINLDVNTTLLSAIQREGLKVPLNLEYQRSVRSPVRLSIIMRDGRDARLFTLDDSLRRGSFHAGEESGARDVAPDSHAVSRRLAQSGPVSRWCRRAAAREARDHARWSVSHQHC